MKVWDTFKQVSIDLEDFKLINTQRTKKKENEHLENWKKGDN